MKGLAWFIAMLTGFALSQLFTMYRHDFPLLLFMALLLVFSSVRICDWLLAEQKESI